MTRNKILTVIGLIVIIAAAYFFSQVKPKTESGGAISFVNQAPHSATGFGIDAARVDSQITFEIPAGKTSEVYDYLVKTYVESDGLLKEKFPELNLKGEQRADISNFTDDYFDTPNLDLLKNQNSVRHRFRINTTDPTDVKSGRELVQLKLTPPGQFEARDELKFEVKHRKRNNTLDDLHPLIRIIKTKQQADFKRAFYDLGIDPYSLRYILTNNQKRSRVYLDLDGVNILSFSVDVSAAKFWWANAEIHSMDVGLVETVYTAAPEAQREKLGQIRNFVIEDLNRHFPDLKQNLENKYYLLFKEIEKKIPFLDFLIRWKII